MDKRYLFRWKAADDSGSTYNGCLFASDAGVVIESIMKMKQLPLRISRGRCYQAGDWKTQHKIDFVRQLATLLKAGMPLASALALLAEGHPDAAWQALLVQLQQKITAGNPFSQTLLEWPDVFPPLYSALIHTGELTGKLDECCLRLAQQQERQQLLQHKVEKALRYPLFILAVALLVSIGMLLFVLPEFEAIYRTFDAPLPGFTAATIAFSQLLQRWGPLLTGPLVITALFYRRQRQRSVSVQRREQLLLLKLPLLSSLYRGSQLSLLYTTLSLTQQAGLTLLQSLQALEKTLSSIVWREAIIQLQQHIAAGNPLHQALKVHTLFTPLCYQLIKVGEESGALDALLTRLAGWHESQTHQLADTLAATLEPVMMVVIGIVVGALVVAMYLPVFHLGDALG